MHSTAHENSTVKCRAWDFVSSPSRRIRHGMRRHRSRTADCASSPGTAPQRQSIGRDRLSTKNSIRIDGGGGGRSMGNKLMDARPGFICFYCQLRPVADLRIDHELAMNKRWSESLTWLLIWDFKSRGTHRNLLRPPRVRRNPHERRESIESIEMWFDHLTI